MRDGNKFYPDVIVVHPGWGEGLFLKDVYPQSRLVAYAEFYYRGLESDVGFDPEFPATLDDKLRVRNTFIRSIPTLQALRPNAQIVIVGGNDVSYGKRSPAGQSYREIYCQEVKGQVD